MNSNVSLIHSVRSRGAALLVLLSLAVAPAAHGLIPVANGELFVGGEVRTGYDSNVFLNEDEVGDFSVTLTPELEFRREAGVLHLDMRGGVSVRRFLDESVLNAEDFYFETGLVYPVAPRSRVMDRTEQRLDLYYRERTAPVEDVEGVAERKSFGGDYRIRYRLSEKTAVRGGLGAERRQYRSDVDTPLGRLSDRDLYSADGDFIWIYSPKLDFFSGYRFRRTETRRRPEGVRDASSRDHRLSLGAEGELLPKVTGAARAGYQYRDFDHRDRGSRDQFSFDLDLLWEATAQTNVTVGAGRDFRTSADERDVDSTNTFIEASHRLTDPLRLDGRLSYLHERYSREGDRSGRTDHRYGAETGLRYSLTERASTAATYRFFRRESDERRFTYGQHIIDFSVRVRF